MFTTYKNKRISTIYSVIPQNEADFMDEAGNYSFSEPQMKKLKKVMGFDKRRVLLKVRRLEIMLFLVLNK